MNTSLSGQVSALVGTTYKAPLTLPSSSLSMSSSSAASSCSYASSSAESLFSDASVSTTETDIETHLPHLRTHRQSSIRLPTRLPPPPSVAPSVDLSALTVDPEFEDLPLGFVIAKLKTHGADLLRCATATAISIPADPILPAYLSCKTTQASVMFPIASPSHILAINSPDASRILLLPVHGLLWAAKSPGLALLSSAPEHQPPSSLLPTTPRPNKSSLPVLELSLPSTRAVPVLQSWIYLSSPSLLLQTLLPSPPTPMVHTTAAVLAAALSHLSSTVLLDRINLTHSLWQNTVALEISDEMLWRGMSFAWSVLVAALGVQERRRVAGLV